MTSRVADTAAELFREGYRIVSRAGRTAARCPPDADPAALLRAAGGNYRLRGETARDHFRRCYSKEKQTVSEGVMRELVRLARAADDRTREEWRARLTLVQGREWRAEVEGVLVSHGRTRRAARDHALQVLGDFPSTMSAGDLTAELARRGGT